MLASHAAHVPTDTHPRAHTGPAHPAWALPQAWTDPRPPPRCDPAAWDGERARMSLFLFRLTFLFRAAFWDCRDVSHREVKTKSFARASAELAACPRLLGWGWCQE